MEEKNYVFTKKQLNFEKIKIISKFSSLASHELKNIVGGLSNIVYYLSKSLKVENETQRKMIELLSKEVVNLNKKIVGIFDMIRIKKITKTECDLQSIILLAMAEIQSAGISFEQELIPAKIYADSEKMKQVFKNILINAKEAMHEYGKIRIEMKLISDTIITTVTDFGSGMSAEVLEQCFEPLFSTKITNNIGMGLPIAQQIIEMHNGTIKVDSEPIKGTTVIISLPIQK